MTHLVTILTDIGIARPKNTARQIFEKAVPFNIKDRYVVSGDSKVRHKASRVIAAAKTSNMTVQRFNRILDAQRREAGHRHITPIRQNSDQYLLLKEIALMACEFSNNVGIASIDEGCTIYIRLGLGKMKRSNQYALGKFKYYDEHIYKLYESLDMLEQDPNKPLTKEFHDVYISLLGEYAGIGRDMSRPEDYVTLVFAKLDAIHCDADADTWIRAQFEELQRAFDAIPNPNQLFGDNAIKRYYSYVGSSTKTKNADNDDVVWQATPPSDFERKYQEKLKQKFVPE